ncbi:MAG: hypothetical protein OXC58_03150 [Acidimicrobiaceae bacterium]|nr:hypothetical protein [Acidimicrobiaceae bacterium]MCY4293825.1 hypothetical protein [Acidimicrobiaceae bacterium]
MSSRSSRLQLKLSGDNARLGGLYASDIARLIDGVERAIRRAASQLVGRMPGAPGRLPKAAVNAARLRLTDIREGSVVLQFELPVAQAIAEPSEQESLDLDDSDLGESALRVVMDVLSGSQIGFTEAAAALSQLAEDLDIGERYDALAFFQLGGLPHKAVLDRPVRERLAAAVQRPNRHDDEGALVGILYEVDFEKSSARLRTPFGSSVAVYFGDDHAQAIKETLRESSRLQGRVTYNTTTSAVLSVDLTDITLTEQLMMPCVGEFWATKTLEELAKAQSVSAVESIEELRDDTISIEEADAFMAALEL